MSVLLVGVGTWGRNWAKTLHGLGALSALCDASAATQESLRRAYPNAAIYADLDAALRHPGLNAAVIAAPVPQHATLAQACLEAGLHTLVEKPLALSPQDADALAALARARGLTLAVGHLLLYHPELLRLKALMDAGDLGEILAVRCTRMNLGRVRDEENVWWSLAPHDLSILGLLFSGEPLTLCASLALPTLGRVSVPDEVMATFATPSGKRAVVHVNWLAPVKRHETQVIGTRGIAVFDDALPPGEKLRVLACTLAKSPADAVTLTRGDWQAFAPADPQGPDLLTRQAQAFLAAARGENVALPNDAANGCQVVRLLAAVGRAESHAPSRA